MRARRLSYGWVLKGRQQVSVAEYNSNSGSKPSSPSVGAWYYDYYTSTYSSARTVWDIYAPKYETRDYLAGERWTERVVDWRGWSSQPLSVSVVLKSENHFAGEVALSVFPSSSNLSAALAQTRVQLADGEQKIVGLTLDVVDSSEALVGSYTVDVRASGGGYTPPSARFGVSVMKLGEGDFSLGLPGEVALVQGQASVGVALQSTSRGFDGHVKLSVEGLPSGVQASFDANPVYLASNSSTTLRLRLNGSPSQVRNTVTVVARDLNGQPKASRSFTLYAFEESWVGQVVCDKQPAYSYEPTKSGDAIWIASCDANGRRQDGAVFAKAISGGAGTAWANVTQWARFTPSRSGPVTVEARMNLKSFVYAGATIAGVSHGETAGHVQLNDEWHRQIFDGAWGFDFPIPEPTKIRELLKVIDAIGLMYDVTDVINALRDAHISFEPRVVRYTFDAQAGDTYWVGAGVGANHGSFLIAGGTAVVVGYVSEIKVWNGTAPTVEFRFNEGIGGIARDTSGLMYDGTISGAYWTNGLTSGALSFDGVDDRVDAVLGSDLEEEWQGKTFETWIKPRERKTAFFLRTNYSAFAQSAYWNLATSEDGRFYFRTTTPGPHFWAGSYDTNEWYHVVMTITPGYTYSLYIDGNLVKSEQSYGGRQSCITNVHVGSGPFSEGGYFNGLIEEVKVYDRVLSNGEIVARYHKGPMT